MKSLVTLKALRVAGLATSSSQTLLYVITTRRARYNNRFQDFCCEVLQEESPGPCSSTSGWGASGPAASTSEERATPAHLLLYRDDQPGKPGPRRGCWGCLLPAPHGGHPRCPSRGRKTLTGDGGIVNPLRVTRGEALPHLSVPPRRRPRESPAMEQAEFTACCNGEEHTLRGLGGGSREEESFGKKLSENCGEVTWGGSRKQELTPDRGLAGRGRSCDCV